MNEPNYFSTLLDELNTRSARAVVSQMGVNSNALRRHLQTIFEQKPGQEGSFLAEPVFEATFPWKLADVTMDDLSRTLLHPNLVDAMDQPPQDLDEFRFPRERSPVPPPTTDLEYPQARAHPISSRHEWDGIRENRVFFGSYSR